MSSPSQLQSTFLQCSNSIRINQNDIQRSKLLVPKSQVLPIKQASLNLDVRVQNLVEKIRASPSKEMTDILRIIENDTGKTKCVLDRVIEIGYHPDVSTITVVINLLCKKGKVQRAFEVLEVMDRIGCKPTVQIYNCLLKGLCYVGRVEEAYEMLMNIKKGLVKPDIYTYTVVMDGFCKVGRSNEAVELLHEAMEVGLEPNVVTYNTLFTGYCKEGRPLKGFGVLNHMKERNCRPDFISYSTLLNGLLKWGEVKAALKIYEEMVRIGFEVEEMIENRLLRRLCRKSWEERELVDDAHQLFDKMIEKKVSVMDPCTRSMLIRAFCLGGKTEEALIHLKEMIAEGFTPRTITFNNVIQALCLEGKVEEAISVLVFMYEEHKIPSRTSYDFLIKELNSQGGFTAACVVYAAAIKQRVFIHIKPQQSSN